MKAGAIQRTCGAADASAFRPSHTPWAKRYNRSGAHKREAAGPACRAALNRRVLRRH